MLRYILVCLIAIQPVIAMAAESGAVECGEDEGCFLQAVRQCRPAALRSCERRQAGAVSRQTYCFRHEILGAVDLSCVISVQMADLEISFTEAFLEDMAQRGVSDQQLNDMQSRFDQAQSQLNPVMRIHEPRRFHVSPGRYDQSMLRRMNMSFLPDRLPPSGNN